MFKSIKQRAKIERLETEINKLNMEVERIEARKKTEEQELKHMIRMKEERMDIELDKKVMAIEKRKDSEIAEVKDKYRDKLEDRLTKESENIKEMYGEILQRLPNISAKLSGKL